MTEAGKKTILVIYNYSSLYPIINLPLRKEDKPKLVQGMDIVDLYYEDKSIYDTVKYDWLKDRGYIIIFDGYNYRLIPKSRLNQESNSIPFNNQPKNVKSIIYNPFYKAVRLMGNNCSDELFNIK